MPTHARPAARGLLALVAAAATAGGLFAQAPASDPVLERMRKDIFYLAGPECEGRGIDGTGIEKAAAYIADSFKASGLKPAAADGSYFQPFSVYGSAKLGTPNNATVTAPDGSKKELKFAAEYTPMGFTGGEKLAGAGLVFAGYGITAPKLNYDDYAGLDAAGKVVVVLRKTPRPDNTGDDRFDQTAAKGEDSQYAALLSKIENAAAHKAAGIVFVNDAVNGKKDELVSYQTHASGAGAAQFPVIHVKRAVIDAILKDATGKGIEVTEQAIDKDLKPRSAALTGYKLDAQATVSRTKYAVKNVVAVAEGSGPLADETVVIGAHYDHLGYGSFGSLGGAGANGKVHYGADDNGSGTTGLLELARRFGAMKDRRGRRVVFVAFTGEERGLYGSIHYCKEPPFPLDKTVAMLNMDMIGRVTQVAAEDPKDPHAAPPPKKDGAAAPPEKKEPELTKPEVKKDRVVIYGTGTADTFDKMVDAANARYDFRLFKIPGGTGPSDHDSFYRKKIPVLFLFSGTHPDYHKPTDTPERINLQGLRKIVNLVEDFATELAAVTARPVYQVTKGGWEDPTDPKPRPKAGGPKLGIMPGNYEEEEKGLLVGGLSPGGAAEKGGLKEGDLIVEIGGKPVKNVGGYMTAMAAQKVGQAVDVVVLRKGQRVTVKLTPQ